MTTTPPARRQGLRARLEAWADERLLNRLSLATLALSLTVLLPAAALSFVLSWRLVREELADRHAAAARHQADRVALVLQAATTSVAEVAGSTLVAAALVGSPGWQQYGVPYLRAHQLPIPVEARLALCDPRGRILASGGEPPSLAPLDWLEAVVERGRWVAAVHEAGAAAHLLVVAPIRPSGAGRVEGSVAAEIPLAPLAAALLGGGGPSRLVGPDGRGLTGDPAAWRSMLTTLEPVRVEAPFDELGLQVETAVPPGAAATALAWLAGLHVAVALLVLALALVVARRLSLRLAQPLADLAEAAWVGSANAEGGLRIPVQGRGETARLAVAFNELLEQLDRSRQAAEAGLRLEKREAELAALLAHGALERSAEAISICDASGRIAYVNEAGCRLLGRPRSEVEGRHAWEVDRNLTWERWERLAARVRASGRHTAEREAPAQGGRPCWIEVNVYVLRLGEAEYFVSVMRDVTSRREAEAALRLAGVGTLAAGAAHEINNPLTSVMGNLAFLRDLLATGVPPGGALPPAALGEAREAVDDAFAGAERVRDVVGALKTFARPDDEARAPTSLAEVARGAVNLARNQLRHEGRLVERYGEAPPVLAAGRRLEQVVLNLLVNAAQALPEKGGVVTVTVGTTPGGEAFVEVRDNGSGMTPEVQARAFDPFFTTKPVGAGTGLGLAICHGIVAATGGRIELESEAGRGSAFRVVLPALEAAPDHRAAPAPAAAAVPAPPPLPAALRILVIDDDRPVLRAVLRAIGPGPEVVALEDPQEALRRLLAGERFDLVLCDLMMPGLSGMELYAAVEAARPAAAGRFVFITGGAFTPRAREFLAAVQRPCFEKPFEPDALRRLMAGRLEALAAEA